MGIDHLLNRVGFMAYQEEGQQVSIFTQHAQPLLREQFRELFARASLWYDHHTDAEIQALWDEAEAHLRADREAVASPEPITKKVPKPGVVYLLKSGKYYKIGKSIDFPQRKIQLDIQLPEVGEVIAVLHTDDPTKLETYWHTCFSAKRLNGEWFKLTKADIRQFMHS